MNKGFEKVVETSVNNRLSKELCLTRGVRGSTVQQTITCNFVAREHGTAACFQTLLWSITGNQILLTSIFLHTVTKAVLRFMYPASTARRKRATDIKPHPRVLEATLLCHSPFSTT